MRESGPGGKKEGTHTDAASICRWLLSLDFRLRSAQSRRRQDEGTHFSPPGHTGRSRTGSQSTSWKVEVVVEGVVVGGLCFGCGPEGARGDGVSVKMRWNLQSPFLFVRHGEIIARLPPRIKNSSCRGVGRPHPIRFALLSLSFLARNTSRHLRFHTHIACCRRARKAVDQVCVSSLHESAPWDDGVMVSSSIVQRATLVVRFRRRPMDAKCSCCYASADECQV